MNAREQIRRMLVTGTTGGIGAAVKAAAQAAGWEVVEINRADFESLGQPGGCAIPILDAIVFCTGMCPVKPAALTSDALFAETVRVNCGLFLSLMRTVVANRLFRPSGLCVRAISSVSATEGWPGGAAYCASKGALSALCRALDAELKGKKISVQALEPRFVKTRMFDQCAGRMGVDAAEALPPDEFAEQVLMSLNMI